MALSIDLEDYDLVADSIEQSHRISLNIRWRSFTMAENPPRVECVIQMPTQESSSKAD